MVRDVKSGSDAFLLDISDLHVQYVTDDTTVFALEGFDLQVRRGESWAWSARPARARRQWPCP